MFKLSNLVSREYRASLFWGLQIVGWLIFFSLALAFSGMTYLEWGDAFWLSLLRTGLGLVITSLFRVVYRRMRAVELPMRSIVLWVLVLAALGSVVDTLITRTVGELTMRSGDNFTLYVYGGLPLRLSIYLLWSVLYFTINYWLETQRRDLELAETEANAQAIELQALRAQINPHFLFNALGSILAVSKDSDAVRRLTLALSDYLRMSLQQRRDLEPLETEIRALSNYLEVEQIRFEDKLKYEVSVDEQAGRAMAPYALIQPLLENAIKYGQQTSTLPLRVELDARVHNDELVVTVTNSGRWLPPEEGRSTGTGLANLRRRLELMYQGRATLEVAERDRAVQAVVRLPAEFQGDEMQAVAVQEAVG